MAIFPKNVQPIEVFVGPAYVREVYNREVSVFDDFGEHITNELWFEASFEAIYVATRTKAERAVREYQNKKRGAP